MATSMMMRIGLLCAALLGGFGLVHAEVYKWLDADGKIQYGDAPPKDVKAQKVSGGVTVVPAFSFPSASAPAAKPSAASSSSSEETARDAEARRRQEAADAAAEARRKAIEQCEKNRGVNCEETVDTTGGTTGSSTVFVPTPGWTQPPIVPHRQETGQSEHSRKSDARTSSVSHSSSSQGPLKSSRK